MVIMVHSNMRRVLKSNLKYYKKTAAETGKEFNCVFVAMDIPKEQYPQKAAK